MGMGLRMQIFWFKTNWNLFEDMNKHWMNGMQRCVVWRMNANNWWPNYNHCWTQNKCWTRKLPFIEKCWRARKAVLAFAKWSNRSKLFLEYFEKWSIRQLNRIVLFLQVVKTHSLQQQEETDSTRNVRGEVQTKTTFQRSAKVKWIVRTSLP